MHTASEVWLGGSSSHSSLEPHIVQSTLFALRTIFWSLHVHLMPPRLSRPSSLKRRDGDWIEFESAG